MLIDFAKNIIYTPKPNGDLLVEFDLFVNPANLIPPPGESIKIFQCGCHSCEEKGTSEIELDLATRKHRWPEIQSINERFFRAYYKKALEYYDDILAALKLPDAKTIRQAIANGDRGESGTFELPADRVATYYRILDEWSEDLTGKKLSKAAGAMDPIYDQQLSEAFTASFQKYAKMFYESLPEEVKAELSYDEFYQSIPVNIENRYAMSMRDNGLQRISTRLAETYRDDVLLSLQGMAESGAYPLDVGRFLYKSIGEGQAWYWNRLVRSEATLAVNVSFDYMAEQTGAVYEVWSAAGGACPICSAFDGRVWRVNEGPQPVSDSHPHCTTWNTKIYTSTGWRFIRDIKVGDLVLSHKGKFRKVTFCHKHNERNQAMVKVSYKNSAYMKNGNKSTASVTFTDNHPMLVNGEWLGAGRIKPGDKIRLLATRCKACGKLIPFSRWRDKKGEESRFCSQECNTKNTVEKYGGEYLTQEFHKNTKRLVRSGKHHFQTDKNIRSRANSSNSRQKYNTESELLFSKALEKAGINFMRQQIIKRPEKRNCWKNGEMNRFYKVDFLLPGMNIVIECNGEQWSRDVTYDETRKNYIESQGYTVLDFDNEQILGNVDQCVQEVRRVLKNHSGEYEFIDVTVSDVEFSTKGEVALYNLSVDKDESYIAKGFVVHNCLCYRYPQFNTDKPVQPRWEGEDPYSGVDARQRNQLLIDGLL